VPLAPDACYRAIVARDARFDGLFYVGVTTTGIYCRPVCKARTPGRDRCRFFRTAAEAEREGFRACLRCRPELAPGQAPVDALSRLAARALIRIDEGCLDDGSADDLAASLGVSGRHLRRAVEAEMGVSPIELAQSRRLALARQLLADGNLPITEVAFASGFGSLRRFNALYRARCGQSPSAARRRRSATPGADSVTIRLGYRPPLDWEALMAFLAARAIPGVEEVAGGIYRRRVKAGASAGVLAVAHDPARNAVVARVPTALVRDLGAITARLRALFDLDARPDAIRQALADDPWLGPLVRARPGLRLPGAFDPFETAVRAVLGQQVSVRAATTLAGRLVEALGERLPEGGLFPTAAILAGATERHVAAVGVPRARARTLIALGCAVAERRLLLDLHGEGESTLAALAQLPGVGPWTGSYVALRGLHWPDAFPAGDLGVRRALGGVSEPRALEMAESWRPWRGYAVMHLWTKDLTDDPRDVLRQPHRPAHPGQRRARSHGVASAPGGGTAPRPASAP
jgi:AraC family transcriptional regulator, regulatory protein of adaptative response / DNA-3-methyladenine glycosylase II